MATQPQAFAEAWLEGPMSIKFYTRIYTPPPSIPTRAVIVFIHGYLEHVGRYTHFHTRWAENGVAVFTHDLRGFGRTALGEERSEGSAYGKTGGLKERMLDLEWAIKHAHSMFPDVPLFLHGHSMGGTICLSFVTLQENPAEKSSIAIISGILTSGPLLRGERKQPSKIALTLYSAVSTIFPNFSLPTPLQSEDLSHDPNVGPACLQDPFIRGFGSLEGIVDMLARGELLLSQDYRYFPDNLPVLFVQGTDDMMSAYPPNQEFFQRLSNHDKEFIVYEGMKHDLINEPEVKERYFQDCLKWLQKHVKSLEPSDAII